LEEDPIVRKSRNVPRFASASDFERYLPSAPILSSREAGWQHLMLRTYQVPLTMEETLLPGTPDIFLLLVTGGSVQIHERDLHGSWITYAVHEGDWLLTPAKREPYILRWKSLSPDPLTSIQLHLSADLFARTVQQVADRDLQRVVVLEQAGFQDPLLAHLALSLQNELQHSTTGSLVALYAETAAQMLSTHLLRHYTTTEAPIHEYTGKLSSHQLRRLTSFIQDHLDQDLSLEMLAQQVGFSPYHFARLFHQTTGETPHQFVLRQRLVEAARLLKETNWPIAQVASAIGIPNQSHFTQAFKQYLGITPRAYRQEL
jgi:AraC family transcriptional regulator